VERESTLHAYTVGSDASHGEAGARSIPMHTDDSALKGLHSLALTLYNAQVYFDGIARVQLGDIWIGF